MKYTFPDNYAESTCYLIPINVALLPFVAGALKHFEERRSWHSDEEYERAYNAFAELQACMTALCIRELIESNNRLYRLFDVTMNGAIYSYTGDGTALNPYVFNPPIPVVPYRVGPLEPSVRFTLDKLTKLHDNLVNGTTSDVAPDDRNFRQQLADILLALGSEDSLDPEILAKLGEILLALA